MNVNVSDLKCAANLLFQHLEATGHTQLSFNIDYYWSIPTEHVYNVYEEPHDLTIGQISDDLSELMRIVEGDSEPNVYALAWLASILRAAADTMPGDANPGDGGVAGTE